MSGLVAHLQDLLASTPFADRTRFRAMFGGHGLYLDNRMCAIVFNDGLYLKTDANSRQDFLARGLGPFVYLKRGEPMPLSYYQAPAEALEDSAELSDWLDRAAGAAARAATKKRSKKRRA